MTSMVVRVLIAVTSKLLAVHIAATIRAMVACASLL